VEATELEVGAFWRFLGMRAVPDEAGAHVVRLEVRPEHMQVMGRVHGGVLASLIDSAIALAVHEPMASGSAAATLDLNVQYLRPVEAPCVLVARGRILSRGGAVALASAEVTDSAGGPPFAVGSASYRLYPKRDNA